MNNKHKYTTKTTDSPSKSLTETIERLTRELAEAKEEAEKYQRWYHEESERASENSMYKQAFKALVKEIRE